ncbi:MAG: hypothetical protein ACFCUE_02660 [Candidatus Bathyarchaeia archaeon]
MPIKSFKVRRITVQYDVLVFIIVSIGTLAIIFTSLFLPVEFFVDFLIGYIAGVLGILLGFGIQGLINRDKDDLLCKDYLKLIRTELEETKVKLSDSYSIDVLYTDVWDSAIFSGTIRLLSAEQVVELSKTYKAIKKYSFQAEIIKKRLERLDNLTLREKQAEPYMEEEKRLETRIEITKANNALAKRIGDILKQSWWKK